MPEGDSIVRTARVLDRALAGKQVTRFETVLPALVRVDDATPIRGRTITSVSAVGKHLLIYFSEDLVLRTHMRMNGSWHVYQRGERWKAPRSEMRIVIGTSDVEAVGFNIPVADFHHGAAVSDLAALGPDIISDAFDPAEALRRLRTHSGEEIANVMLDQRVIAGIGNIYKSEALFAAGVNPFENIETLDDETLARVIRKARGLMRRAANGPRDRWAVYERSGQPCRRCGSRIAFLRQGPDARGTYWCPRCQSRIGGHGSD